MNPPRERDPISHPELTYPPPRYHGEGGLATATLRPSDHEPDLIFRHLETRSLRLFLSVEAWSPQAPTMSAFLSAHVASPSFDTRA